MARNKVVLGDGEVLIDLTKDTVTADKLASGITAHDKSGAIITGSNTNDANTSDATVLDSEIVSGKVAYAKGQRVVGIMPNNEAVAGTISNKDDQYIVPMGFHDGSGTVGLSEEAKAPIVAGNIKKGINILGVVGTMDGSESVTVQAKTVTPTIQGLTVNPDVGYDYLSSVTVSPIPVKEEPNEFGGNTVTIG